jgi:hypothetical protein
MTKRLIQLKGEIDEELRPYRSTMTAVQLTMLEQQMWATETSRTVRCAEAEGSVLSPLTNALMQLTIEKLVYGGDGLARTDRGVVFVPRNSCWRRHRSRSLRE